jgi:aminomethyltransferase
VRIVVNASNIAKDEAHFREHAGGMCEIINRSDETALIAVQGPRARALSAELGGPRLLEIAGFHFGPGEIAGKPVIAARTGYTGEDGFEVFVETAQTGALWDALLDAVRAAGGGPVGLGARDTLRLEAGMPLYGNELDRSTTPFDAGLGRVVKLDKPADFVGRVALEKAAAEGPKRRLVGLTVEGRGIARHGYPVHAGERRTGIVTSGTQSPTLGVPIAMAYVTPEDAEPATMLDIEIRDARVPARVVPLPFYRRSS